MAFKHGNHTHDTVADARACEAGDRAFERHPETRQRYGPKADGAVADYRRTQASLAAGERAARRYTGQNATTYRRRTATDPMVRFVRSLAKYKAMHDDDRAEAERLLERHDSGEQGLDFSWAKRFIDGWKDAPQRTDRRQGSPSVVTEDGMYRDPDTETIYKVQYNRATGDGRRLYAKLLVVETEAERDESGKIIVPAKVRFDYISGLLGRIKPEWKLGLEEAKQFGALYGTCIYGHPLTDEESIRKGIGPVCEKKFRPLS